MKKVWTVILMLFLLPIQGWVQEVDLQQLPHLIQGSHLTGRMVEYNGYLLLTYTTKLEVVDLSAPGFEPVATLDIPDGLRDLSVSGTTGYLACGDYGIRTCDLSDPEHPVLTGQYSIELYAAYCEAEGDRLYVSGFRSGEPDRIQIYSTEQPDTLIELGMIPDHSVTNHGMATRGDTLFVVRGGVRIYDTTNPSDVQIVSESQPPEELNSSYWETELYLVDDHVFALGFDADDPAVQGLRVVDVTDLSSHITVSFHEGFGDRAFALNGTTAYIGGGPGSGSNWEEHEPLHILDLSDLGNPVEVGTFEVGRAVDLFYHSGRLFVRPYISRGPFTILDVTQPHQPEILATFPLASSYFRYGAVGTNHISLLSSSAVIKFEVEELARAGDWYYSLFETPDVWDYSMAEADTWTAILGRTRVGDELDEYQLYIYGLTESDQPGPVSTVVLEDELPLYIPAPVHNDSILFVANQGYQEYAKLRSVNLSDPASPFLQGTTVLRYTDRTAGLMMNQDTLLVFHEEGYLMLDVSNASRFSILGQDSIAVPWRPKGTVENGILTLGSIQQTDPPGYSITRYFLDDPDSLSVRNQLILSPRYTRQSGPLAFYDTLLATTSGGYPDTLWLFSLNDSGSVNPLFELEVGYGVDELFWMQDGLIVKRNWEAIPYRLIRNEAGVRLEEVQPHQFRLLAAYPNPFNPSTMIPFELERESLVRLAIYDLLGRQVATLVDGPRAAGEHRIEWDGRSSSGIPVASGSYLVKLEAGGMQASHRITLVK